MTFLCKQAHEAARQTACHKTADPIETPHFGLAFSERKDRRMIVTSRKKTIAKKQSPDSSIDTDPAYIRDRLDHFGLQCAQLTKQSYHPHISANSFMGKNMQCEAIQLFNCSRPKIRSATETRISLGEILHLMVWRVRYINYWHIAEHTGDGL